MKKNVIIAAFLLGSLSPAIMAQNATNHEEMMSQWRLFKHQRNYAKATSTSNLPIGDALPQTKSVKALPEDRVWFPGEWEEVQAITVTPYYYYIPDTNLGNGNYSADPLVTGVAEYYRYSTTRGWVTMNIYGPYRSIMDTISSFGRVFFYLMDGIQKGHAEAWVRVEKAADTAKVLRTLARMRLRHDSTRFIIGPGNSFWYRDCGPICFYHGDQDSLAMMDFEYYPGRALDDSLPSLIYRQMGLPNYINTLEWEGGNCLVDGAGFLLSSNAIYNANGDNNGQITWDGRNRSSIHFINKPRLTQTQTRAALRSLIGQRETHILPAFAYDGGTGHIDLYADMCDENGFVFSIIPDTYSNWTDYRTGSRNIDSLCSYTSIFNRQYSKSTIPFPKADDGRNFLNQDDYNNNYTRTYSNHTFVNDLILQPCFSSVSNGVPSASWDRENIEKLKAAYPGYTIYPVDVREFDGSGGAIHCVTKQIPADNPIRILHKSIVNNASDMRGHDIPVSAIITNRSGIAHAECIFRVDNGEWQTLPLTANGNKFSALLPTASINERIIDTTFQPRTTIDSVLTNIDTLAVIDSTFSHIDTTTFDSIYTYDTSFTYHYHYQYDTTLYTDTITTLHDTLITFEYYIRATSNNGKTTTKPITAHNGGYYSFHFDGQLMPLDSNKYDFDTEPRPNTDITFVFDANRTTLDTSSTPTVGIDALEQEQNFGQFYPNPATSQANIKINLGNGSDYTVLILDNLGRTIHTSTLQAAGEITYSIRTALLPPGIYTVVFHNGFCPVSRRLVVK